MCPWKDLDETRPKPLFSLGAPPKTWHGENLLRNPSHDYQMCEVFVLSCVFYGGTNHITSSPFSNDVLRSPTMLSVPIYYVLVQQFCCTW